MTPQQAYIQRILPYAERSAQRLGVHPMAIIGQMALETNWGRNILKGTNNHGNIMEIRNGVNGVYANDNGNRRKFRIFANDGEFFDHFDGLMERKYKGIKGQMDPFQYGRALKAGGYAENPNYARDIATMYNAVAKRMPGYKWNGQATTQIPVPQGNSTMGSMAGGGENTTQAPTPYSASNQPSVLGQPIGGSLDAPLTPQGHSNSGLDFLNVLTGQQGFKNSFWRS